MADALPTFSLDVVGVVAAYVVCGVATAGAKPSHLFEFGPVDLGRGRFLGSCCGLACSANGNIWLCAERNVQVFNSDGEFLFRVRGWDPLESTCRHASLSIL